MISDEDVERIASAVVEKATEDVGIRDVIIGSAMGKGAIPLYGRELRREPCSCCLIDPEGPNAPENRMCTSSGCIGTLKDSEEREWCSEINIVPNGRCARARGIREAAARCKEEHPTDTAAFFACYAPAFSKITKGSSNPGDKERARILWTRESTQQRTEILESLGLDKEYFASPWSKLPPDYRDKLASYYEAPHYSNPGEYVTITDPGKTTFKVGEVVSREAFEKENERVKKLGEKPATGR